MASGIESRQAASGKRYRWIINRTPEAGGRLTGPWVGKEAEARAGRIKAQGEIAAGTAARNGSATLRAEWATFIAGATAGTIRKRNGQSYKPATLRGYKRGWAKIDPELGAHKLTAIKKADVQTMVDGWMGSGMSASTIRNSIDPLRVLYRRAVARDLVAVNPTTGVEVPHTSDAAKRIADKDEIAQLIAAVPDEDSAVWATAAYAGLRRGELRALRWNDVDLTAKTIHVRRAWDDVEGEQEPKTKGSVRKVPIVRVLETALRAHETRTGRKGSDLVFGRSATEPFIATTIRSRAIAAWEKADKEKAKQLRRDLHDDETLTPITLHECRHTCASLMIAAGANAKALSVVMGHATITITFDTYGHLMPGGEAEVGKLLSAYLDA